ncbi:hypothetical protein [Aliiglaciecola sp. LCG003]|uniref:hypothetical protein n=1 Tax=Aliiglaciecola sp. LCG003 TaxID=3053655 RepID=UPI002572E386|nr:hypothetical protein [Aliiglaciecola sp. LCG003]WJG08157.1 hypothetical protein QR722_12490 [Aliiglaciecola sp. LCG003]
MNKYGSKVKFIVVLSLTMLLAACGSTPQPTVAMTSNIFAKPDVKVGYVYVAPEDKATTHIYGASCLLCYGVASTLTSKLDRHLETQVDANELENIKALVLEEYGQKTPNIKIVSLSKPIAKMNKFKGELGFAKKDFRALKQELDIDVLVVLELHRHGAFRSFSQYIPNGDPQGHIAGLLYAVDLESNAYVQYLSLDEKVQPEGEWDEPPTFPSVTTSYYQAIENFKAKVRDAI